MTVCTDDPKPTKANHRTRVFALIAFMVLCLIISAAGGAVTATSVNDWYTTLQKPFFNPPNWLFAPVWTAIYFMIAFSGWRVWLTNGFGRTKIAFGIYGAQLLLNLAWSFLFFGAESPLLGLIDIIPLFILIVINTIVFFRLDRLAGLLLLPYVAWVGFASLLNAAIWHLNG